MDTWKIFQQLVEEKEGHEKWNELFQLILDNWDKELEDKLWNRISNQAYGKFRFSLDMWSNRAEKEFKEELDKIVSEFKKGKITGEEASKSVHSCCQEKREKEIRIKREFLLREVYREKRRPAPLKPGELTEAIKKICELRKKEKGE